MTDAPTQCPLTDCQSEDVVTKQRMTYCRTCKGVFAISTKWLSDEEIADTEAALWAAKHRMEVAER